MARMLLLRYDGAFPPQHWESIGGECLGEGVWRFTRADAEAGRALLDALAADTHPQVLKDTLALELDATGPYPSVATFLRDARSLDALIIRRRYAWLLGDFRDRVRIHFQPIVDLLAEGQIIAYEALCRLDDPQGPLLNGGQAFELARAAGRAAELDTVSQGLALARKAAEIPRGVALFLNVLPQSLLQPAWRANLSGQLDALGIDPRDLVVEVVESEQADPAELATACDELRRAGVRVALDDIGAGFNGLSVLAAVRADYIKIDRGLVHQAQRSRVRTVLLEALVSMAQRLGTRVVAEGLERPEDILFCREMSIGYAQGYFFAPPAEQPAAGVAALPPRSATQRSRPQARLDLTQLMDSSPTLNIAESVDAARAVFAAYPSLPSLVLVDRGHPVGILPRGQALSRGARSLGQACVPIRHYLPQEVNPMQLARRLFLERQEQAPWIVVSDSGHYLGTVSPALLLANIMTCRDGGAHLHPLTHLPTGPDLRHTLESRLAGPASCTLVYVDLDHFKAYNDRYGFVRGDAMIRLLSELLRCGFAEHFGTHLGHIGGDDFVLLVEHFDPSLLEGLKNVIAQFHSLALHLYDEGDVRRGYFVTDDDAAHPIAHVSVAVVDGSTGRPGSAAAAAERAAALKKLAKSRAGSVVVVEGTPPRLEVLDTPTRLSPWERNAIQALERIAAMVRNADPHRLDAAFADFPYFEVVFELDAEGVQRHPNWLNPEMYGRIKAGGQGVDRSHQPYFRSIRQRRRPYVSSIYLSSATEDFCLTVALPLLEDGEVRGALVADINIASLAEWTLREAAGGTESPAGG